ncbi:hypothetical protein MA16_Dca023536 [Dendrobium catenatum]|uniref:Uncharacterized protein n=1 Tax=Dendrobium catenatum TaxID=906689 RepID=A0A2I0XBA0_9ASPA|nr:hypothetical protein MA16_Dca023536 [Dendrobium catenatum]
MAASGRRSALEFRPPLDIVSSSDPSCVSSLSSIKNALDSFDRRISNGDSRTRLKPLIIREGYSSIAIHDRIQLPNVEGKEMFMILLMEPLLLKKTFFDPVDENIFDPAAHDFNVKGPNLVEDYDIVISKEYGIAVQNNRNGFLLVVLDDSIIQPLDYLQILRYRNTKSVYVLKSSFNPNTVQSVVGDVGKGIAYVPDRTFEETQAPTMNVEVIVEENVSSDVGKCMDGTLKSDFKIADVVVEDNRDLSSNEIQRNQNAYMPSEGRNMFKLLSSHSSVEEGTDGFTDKFKDLEEVEINCNNSDLTVTKTERMDELVKSNGEGDGGGGPSWAMAVKTSSNGGVANQIFVENIRLATVSNQRKMDIVNKSLRGPLVIKENTREVPKKVFQVEGKGKSIAEGVEIVTQWMDKRSWKLKSNYPSTSLSDIKIFLKDFGIQMQYLDTV